MQQEIIRQNIQKILNELNLTAYAASRKAGLNSNTLLRFIQGTNKSINEATLIKISKALEIDPKSFETGELTKIKASNDNSLINANHMRMALEYFQKDFASLKLSPNQENEIITNLYNKISEIESIKSQNNADSLEIETKLQESILKMLKK
jgi:transcriptional regulator with XRE-family HTH domain